MPNPLAKDACAGLELDALEKFLARAEPAALQADSLESWLCAAFGVADLAIAPFTLQADGVEPGASGWMRADPVHIQLQREQMILRTDVIPTPEEAAQLCASLNAHFAQDGLHFAAPHPQRWYVQLAAVPAMQTHPLSQAAGLDVRAHLPGGRDALHWHGVLNEIQMLFFSHAVNQAREERGKPAINSVWFWGAGMAGDDLLQPCAQVIADGDLALALALAGAAGVGAGRLCQGQRVDVDGEGDVLLVWEGLQAALQRGDLATWRSSLQEFERDCMSPLLQGLKAGKIGRIVIDIPAQETARRYELTRAGLWKLWRFRHSLAYYAQ